MTPLRVLITGSRTWANKRQLWDVLDFTYAWGNALKLPLHLTVGGAPGADTIAERWVTGHGLWPAEPPTITKIQAPWGLYGSSAGVIRNKVMVDQGHDLCLAFVTDATNSPGTMNCINLAREAGINVYTILEER